MQVSGTEIPEDKRKNEKERERKKVLSLEFRWKREIDWWFGEREGNCSDWFVCAWFLST